MQKTPSGPQSLKYLLSGSSRKSLPTPALEKTRCPQRKDARSLVLSFSGKTGEPPSDPTMKPVRGLVLSTHTRSLRAGFSASLLGTNGCPLVFQTLKKKPQHEEVNQNKQKKGLGGTKNYSRNYY